MDILEDYCDIFTSASIYHKKERQKKLQIWNKQSYGHMPNFEELKNFLSKIDRQSDIKITYQLEMKVIFPICDKEIFQNNNIEAMKLILLKCPESLLAEYKFMEYKNDCSFDLLDMALKHAPDDEKLLQKKYERCTQYYSFTIHEVPCGVLCGMDGATIEQTKKMLMGLNEYEIICKKLKYDAKDLIEACKLYYTLWIEFISDREKYESFANCLREHNAPEHF